MKKILIIFLCLPLIFSSCKDSRDSYIGLWQMCLTDSEGNISSNTDKEFLLLKSLLLKVTQFYKLQTERYYKQNIMLSK